MKRFDDGIYTQLRRLAWLVGLIGSVAAPWQVYAEQPAAVVSVAPVQQKQLAPTLMVSGQVQSKYQSNLSSGVDGRLDWVAEPGSQVQPGDVLARLDQTPLQLQINELAAKLKRARIQALQLEREWQRQQSLQARALVSNTQLEQAQAAAELAKADVELSAATLAQLQDQLNRTVLKAPFAGVVSQRFHQLGEELSRNTPVLQLVSLTQLEVRVFAPLQYAAFSQPGQTLTVYQPQRQRALLVNHVIPVSDQKSQTFELRLQAAAGEFQIGELVTVAVPTAAATASLVIHRDALVLGKSGHSVFKIDGAHVRRVAVQTGQGEGEWLQVSAALQAGDQLVIRGAETLTDGAQVRVLSDAEFALSTASRAAR